MKYAICTLIASVMMGIGSFAVQPTMATTSIEAVAPVNMETNELSQEPERLQKTRMGFGSHGTKVAKNVLIGTVIVVGVCAILIVGGTALAIWALSGLVPLGL